MRELVLHYETFEEEPVFLYTTIVWKDNGNYYQLNHPERQPSYELDKLPQPRYAIPMELFRARWDPSFTESPNPPPTDSYIKNPEIYLNQNVFIKLEAGDLEKDTSSVSGAPRDNMLSEAKIYEILKCHPHTNICVYYGCVRDGDYFTALCLKKYRCTLYDAIQNADITLEPTIILDGISTGLNFLHETLGLVHNDINPRNIMLDDQGNAVIIDFDSCMPIGRDLKGHKGGTPHWMPELPPTVSLPENDLYGLKLIAEYLKKNVNGEGEMLVM